MLGFLLDFSHFIVLIRMQEKQNRTKHRGVVAALNIYVTSLFFSMSTNSSSYKIGAFD